MSIELTMSENNQVMAALICDEKMKLENISNADRFRKATRMGIGVEKMDGIADVKVVKEHIAGEGESLSERKKALAEKTKRDLEFDKSQLSTKTQQGGNRDEVLGTATPFDPLQNHNKAKPRQAQGYPN